MKTKFHSIRTKINNRIYYIHWSFLLIIAWVVIINLISVVTLSELLWGIILLMAFMLSLVVHESAHAIAGNIFGIKRDDLLLLPSGSVGGGVDSIKNFRVKTVVLLAGPFTNLAIAFLLKFFIQPYSAYWNEPANIGVVDPGNFLFQVHLINLSLGVVNLIPVLPTDAGRILRGILSMAFNQQKSERLVTAWTKWVAIACLPLGLYYFNLLLLLFAIYILITRRAESQLVSPHQEGQPRSPVEPMDFFLNHSHIS